jgi:thiol-disulfide isomerase/thioredoxin
MMKRWILAAVVVVALVYAIVPQLPLPGLPSFQEEDVEVADQHATVCPAGAKKANLDFTIEDMNGQKVKLASYKGKVILLDFWATWCGPCKAEIPNFVELQQQYGRQGLSVLGLSVDDTVDKLKPFADDLKMNYPVLVGLGRDDVQDAFGPIWGIPTTFLISRDGRICRKNTGIQGKDKYDRSRSSRCGLQGFESDCVTGRQERRCSKVLPTPVSPAVAASAFGTASKAAP